MTSGIEAKGRFGKQDFRYVAEEDIYVCPAGQKLAYHYTNEENGLVLRRYWTNACQSCAIQQRCTTGKDGSRVGNMSMCWRRYRSVSIRTRRPCASVARRPNIPSAR